MGVTSNGGSKLSTQDTVSPLPESYTRDDVIALCCAGKLDAEAAGKALSVLTARSFGKLMCKVGRKGAISVYGLQRMPVTLYAGQWERFLDGHPTHFVLLFIKEWEGREFQGKDKDGDFTTTISRK